jgi:uncharacterized protein
MDIDFLGVGWTSPIQLDRDGQIQMARYEDTVRQSIWMILSTAKGERVMRPDFGCGIHDKVFLPNTLGTVGQIVSDVRDALVNWEPRIDVLNVNVIPDRNQPNVILIQVDYQIRTTNNIFNLVYPFYLQ